MKKDSITLPLIYKTSNTLKSREYLLGSNSPQPSSTGYSSLTQRTLRDDSPLNVFEISQEKALSPTNIGPNARLEFFNYYKNIINLSEKQKYKKEEKSASVAYLNSLVKCKLKPRAFGIVKNSGQESDIDLRMYSMGDNYAIPFSQGIKHYPSLQTLNLKNNRLTDIGNEKILNTIDTRQIKRLNLSENKLGPRSIEKIIEMVSLYDCKLKYLNMEKTNLGESLFISLLGAINYNKSLTKLILAKNNLTDKVAKSVKELLIVNNTLKVLDLHWNLFRASGGKLIFEGIAKNTSLVIFDISWNSLGKSETVSETVGNGLKLNTSLMHLDISYNYFNENECRTIGEFLKSNHTLLGIHVTGNECSLDPKGFLIIDKKNKVEQSLFSRRIIEKQSHFHEVKTNCWICEKWVEQTFTCKSQGSSVFIHFEFNNYKPELMFKLSENTHEITRVVPQETLKFIFSELDDYEVFSQYDKKFESLDLNLEIYEGMSKHLLLNTVNMMNPNGEVCNIKAPFFTKPRNIENKYIPPAEKLEKIKWHLKNSIFKDYFVDNEKILDDCFEFDWKCSKISNFIRSQDEQNSLKTVLRSNYALIKTSYKILSAYSGSDVFSIGSNILNDFLNQCKIYDSFYAISDFGVNLTSTLVQKEKGQIYNPGNSLVRYEFLEILVRIAMDKYIRNKIFNSYNQAMQRLLADHLVPIMSTYKTDKWRNEEYYKEEVDLVLKANKDIFLVIYKKYSGKNTLPGKKPFMSVEEFRQVCIDSGLVGENFATREIDVCFSQSMMTQVDELYNKRHLEMSFIEFLEAICRAIDCSDGFEIGNIKINSLIQSRLSKKIEIALVWLLKICPQSFQDEYVFPNTEFYTKMMYRFVPGR